MPTLQRPERLVVDANPILSALLHGKSRRVFFEAPIREFAVPEVVVREVLRYLPLVALKVGVGIGILESALELLPLTQYTRGVYRGTVADAKRRIEHRDPDDVDLLALTLRLHLPLWSNDRDFDHIGIRCLTTAQLLRMFFGQSSV